VKKIKISDCVSQDQPTMTKTVFDANGDEIATFNAPSIIDTSQAGLFASSRAMARYKTKTPTADQISLNDIYAKTMQLCIQSWKYEEVPTFENIMIILTLPQFKKDANILTAEFATYSQSFTVNQEAIVKNS
jgi:hypothetical protein